MSDAYASMYQTEETEQIGEANLNRLRNFHLAKKVTDEKRDATKKKEGKDKNKAMVRAAAANPKTGTAARMANADLSKVPAKNRIDEDESYTSSYMEAYKKLPMDKMKAKADSKPNTEKGNDQARTMNTVRLATKDSEGMVKDAVKGQEMSNRKKGLEKRFNAPSADKGTKNAAYKLEGQRRKDLDTRYGPKKEEAEAVLDYLIDGGYALNEDSAASILDHMSDEWFEAIVQETLTND